MNLEIRNSRNGLMERNHDDGNDERFYALTESTSAYEALSGRRLINHTNFANLSASSDCPW
jgi:hypothetical protein